MECRQRRTGETPPDEQPFALVIDGPHGQLIHAVTPAARAAGVRPDRRATDARAICPELVLEEHDQDFATDGLARLAEWCSRWSSLVAVDGADGLLLDLTGATHLWGGEGGTARALRRDLVRIGHRCQLAIAPTVGAAWALARYGGASSVRVGMNGLGARLAMLPIESLRLSPATVLLLGRLGLKSMGALAQVPRMPLARRFTTDDPSLNPLTRLDQALGRLSEPVVPHVADLPIRVVRRVMEPIIDLPVVETILREMAVALVGLLEDRGQGLRRALLQAYRLDGGVEAARVETALVTRDARHLRRLFDGRLDHWDAGFGFDAFALTALRAEPLGAAQPGLLGEEPGDLQLARLLDRLVAKLSPTRVCRPAPVESHIPEKSLHWVSALEPPIPFTVSPTAARPLRLLDRPERIEVLYATPEGAPYRFIWRRRGHPIVKVQGPERIATEWWRPHADARERDYYRVEDEGGRRYWLFRHGRYGESQDDEPGWYLHGLFA